MEGRSPPFIAPGFCVAKGGGDTSGGSFSYWPRYSDAALIARATYLGWLDQRINPNSVLIYFYGIDRRLFVDIHTEDEKHPNLRRYGRTTFSLREKQLGSVQSRTTPCRPMVSGSCSHAPGNRCPHPRHAVMMLTNVRTSLNQVHPRSARSLLRT